MHGFKYITFAFLSGERERPVIRRRLRIIVSTRFVLRHLGNLPFYSRTSGESSAVGSSIIRT